MVNDTPWADICGNVLHWAAWEGDKLVVETLLHVPGVDVNAKDCRTRQRTPLHMAALRGHVHVVVLLVNAPGIDVNAGLQYHHWTPLHMAIMVGDGRTVELLLSAPGTNVNARDRNLRTPLHWAVNEQYRHVVLLLLSTPGIDVDARDRHGHTSLDQACGRGCLDFVTLIRQNRRRGPFALRLTHWCQKWSCRLCN